MTIFYPVFYPMSPHPDPVRKKRVKNFGSKADSSSVKCDREINTKSGILTSISGVFLSIFCNINLRIVRYFFYK